MKKFLTHHWLAKLLSLLLAIGIWFLVKKLSTEYGTGSKERSYTYQMAD